MTLSPSGGDDTVPIQSAIDTVAALPLDRKGFRGAVLLSPGYFNVSGTLILNASGVVLRGSGSGSDGSVINVTGSPFALLNVGGSGTYARSTPVSIVESYIPSGARSFKVSDVSGFKLGDNVLVIRPVTEAWVAFMGVQEPPGSHNWCIGCVGTVHSDDAPRWRRPILPNGIYDSLGTHVTPGSLYLAQLKQRLGMRALRNIGYADVDGTPLPAK